MNVNMLTVGDVIKYRAYSLWDEEYYIVDAKVIAIYESGTVRIEYHLDGGIYRDTLDAESVVEIE